MVHGLLDEVADFLGGQPRGLWVEALAVAELGGEGAEAVLGVLVGAVELEDAPGQVRAVLHQFAHVLGLETQGLEERVAEDLHEVVRQALVLLRGEGLQVQLELLGQPDEQGGREGPLVALDEVQVAGADAQGLGQLDLTEPLLAAEEADLGAEARGGLGGGGGGHGGLVYINLQNQWSELTEIFNSTPIKSAVH